MRSRVSAETSVRPFSTLDTVDTETPASAAMRVSVPAAGWAAGAGAEAGSLAALAGMRCLRSGPFLAPVFRKIAVDNELTQRSRIAENGHVAKNLRKIIGRYRVSIV